MEFVFVCHDCGTEFSVESVGDIKEGQGITCPACKSQILRVYYTKCCVGKGEDCCKHEEDECCGGLYSSAVVSTKMIKTVWVLRISVMEKIPVAGIATHMHGFPNPKTTPL